MAKKLSTRDFRKIYMSEVKRDVKRKSFQTIFVGIVAILSFIFADAATNHSLGKDESE